MKLNLQHVHVPSNDDLDSLIENQILALQPRLQIEEANVRLEHRFEVSPAYAVRIHLVIPGPDLFVEENDHTLRAAFGKVMQRLNEQITRRSHKRQQKVKSNLSAPANRPHGLHTL